MFEYLRASSLYGKGIGLFRQRKLDEAKSALARGRELLAQATPDPASLSLQLSYARLLVEVEEARGGHESYRDYVAEVRSRWEDLVKRSPGLESDSQSRDWLRWSEGYLRGGV